VHLALPRGPRARRILGRGLHGPRRHRGRLCATSAVVRRARAKTIRCQYCMQCEIVEIVSDRLERLAEGESDAPPEVANA